MIFNVAQNLHVSIRHLLSHYMVFIDVKKIFNKLIKENNLKIGHHILTTQQSQNGIRRYVEALNDVVLA